MNCVAAKGTKNILFFRKTVQWQKSSAAVWCWWSQTANIFHLEIEAFLSSVSWHSVCVCVCVCVCRNRAFITVWQQAALLLQSLHQTQARHRLIIHCVLQPAEVCFCVHLSMCVCARLSMCVCVCVCVCVSTHVSAPVVSPITCGLH